MFDRLVLSNTYKNILTLLSSLLTPITVGFIAGLITAPSVNTWYEQINKPAFTPPDYLFAPVWSVLYILMGISLYLVVRERENYHIRPAVVVFFIQLLLNFFWSLLFFGLRSPLLGLTDLFFLIPAIITMIFYFYKTSKLAGLLQIPYLLWVSFATILNASILFLN